MNKPVICTEKRGDELFAIKQWKCSNCMELIESGHEQSVSDDPYSMPVCSKCANNYYNNCHNEFIKRVKNK